MRLVRFGAEGYKRFARKTEMNVDPAVIAIVGPNEAGKTSLLEALERLNGSDPFENRELTRGATLDNAHEVVWALYELDDEDRASLNGPPGAAASRWLLEAKRVDGDLAYRLTAPLSRDRAPRKRVAALLRKSNRNRQLRELKIDEENAKYADLASDVAARLERAGEDLDEDTEKLGRALLDVLLERQSDEDPKYLHELARALEDLLESEIDEHPRRSKQATLAEAWRGSHWYSTDALMPASWNRLACRAPQGR